MLRVIQSIAGTCEAHGGTSRSVTALCDTLTGLGVDTHLITGVSHDQETRAIFPRDMTHVHTVRESGFIRQFGVPAGFVRHLRKLSQDTNANKTCIVHDHGLWLASNHAIATESNRLRLKRVVSPDGMLSQWSLKRRRILKSMMWKVRQRNDLESATAFHASSEKEADDIRAMGLKQPIAVIPHGVDIPNSLPRRMELGHKTILFLSRIHPVKGLPNLVQAFHDAQLHEDWRLVIAGPDEGRHQAVVEKLVHDLDLASRVTFPGPIGEQRKWNYFANADLFVLPSYTENFGICVAEALAAGLPVITTTGTPWQVLTEQQMGWWIQPSTEELTVALKDACADSGKYLAQMGIRASGYAKENLLWKRSGYLLKEFFLWLVGDMTLPRPDFVRMR